MAAIAGVLHLLPGTGYPMPMTAEIDTTRIRLLPESLSSQIAAGEVIERPASVVKELLENSIDAGSTVIRIDVGDGGVGLIRVRDNGRGIHPDDLMLAVQSHATSKIREQSDLQHINTLGFRGEALSSIASISHFQLTSRLRAANQGWQIRKDPNSAACQLHPAPHPEGTTVEVSNLFFSTPARRKFLRSRKTEFLRIMEMVRRIAMSRYDISIRLLHDNRQVLYSHATTADRISIIRTIMGAEFARLSIPLDCRAGAMRLWGWLGGPETARSQMDRQYFYFNGRTIRDRLINHALRLAFGNSLPAGRYPSYVLYLEANPEAADVNVHPAKNEIRFRHARDVHDFIHASLSRTLNEVEKLHAFPDELYCNRGERAVNSNFQRSPSTGEICEPYRNFNRNSETDQTGPDAAGSTPLGQPLTLLHGRFLITRRDDDYLLIDCQAARRYLIRIRMREVSSMNPAPQRPLLVPVSMPATAAQADVIERVAGCIRRYGLSMERHGPESILIRTIPALLPDVELHQLVRDILELIVDCPGEPEPEKLVAVFEAHACDGNSAGTGRYDTHQMLWSLVSAGVNPHDAGYPGIWKKLDESHLAAILDFK